MLAYHFDQQHLFFQFHCPFYMMLKQYNRISRTLSAGAARTFSSAYSVHLPKHYEDSALGSMVVLKLPNILLCFVQSWHDFDHELFEQDCT